ncbi:MAG: LuxR C-terminal-related transcriptional regulator [Acidimicrobiales bacterium]
MASSRRGSDGDEEPRADLDPSVRDVVARSQLLCLVIEVPSELIVAASPSAARLLTTRGEDVAGRNLEDFLADDPAGGVELLHAGKLMGYETVRRVRQGKDEIQLHAWVQALRDVAPPRYALIVAWESDTTRVAVPPLADAALPPVVGTVDRDLLIDRISAEVREVLGYGPEALLGQSLLRLVEEPDIANVLLVLGHAATNGRGARHRVRVRTADGDSVLCWVLVLPLVPLPSAAFALLPGEERVDDALVSGRAIEQIMDRLGRTISGATLSREVAGAPWSTSSSLSTLSSRELDIVRRLAAGDRVPTIAATLYVSQSTVRNHLSAVFRKLGVHSQQELIDVLREMSAPSSDE